MRRYDGSAIAEPLDEECASGIHRDLHGEIDGYKYAYFNKGDSKLFSVYNEKKRGEGVYYCLHNVTRIASKKSVLKIKLHNITCSWEGMHPGGEARSERA